MSDEDYEGDIGDFYDKYTRRIAQLEKANEELANVLQLAENRPLLRVAENERLRQALDSQRPSPGRAWDGGEMDFEMGWDRAIAILRLGMMVAPAGWAPPEEKPEP